MKVFKTTILIFSLAAFSFAQAITDHRPAARLALAQKRAAQPSTVTPHGSGSTSTRTIELQETQLSATITAQKATITLTPGNTERKRQSARKSVIFPCSESQACCDSTNSSTGIVHWCVRCVQASGEAASDRDEGYSWMILLRVVEAQSLEADSFGRASITP